MWNQGQCPQGIPWQYQQYLTVPPPLPFPPQVLVAFNLLDRLDIKETPIVGVTNIAMESVDRKELLPVEQKARAAALELLVAYMRSALQ